MRKTIVKTNFLFLYSLLMLTWQAPKAYAQQYPNETLEISKTILPVLGERNKMQVILTAKGIKVDKPIETVLVIDKLVSMNNTISGDPGIPLCYMKQAAINEVRFAKKKQITEHTVALDLDLEVGKLIVEKIASPGCFYESTPNELVGVFQTIANTLLPRLTASVIEDVIPPGFDTNSWVKFNYNDSNTDPEEEEFSCPKEKLMKDSDGDGVSDIYDLDDDNDGILDIDECSTLLNSYSDAGFEYDPDIDFIPSTDNHTGIDGKPYRVWLNYAFPNGIKGNFKIINSVDWTSGQYVLNSYAPAEDYWPIVKPSSNGGAFIIFSRGGEEVQYRVEDAQADEMYELEFELGTLPAYVQGVPGLGTGFSDNRYNADFELSVTGATVVSEPTIATYSMADYPAAVANNSAPLDPKWKVYKYIVKATGGESIVLSFKTVSGECVVTLDAFFVKKGSLTGCDIDNDGLPNYLDLDADNDGCPDAIEGGTNDANDPITSADLVFAGGTLSDGNGGLVTENLCGGIDCVYSNGVPTKVDENSGQGVGSSQDTDNNICYVKTYNDINQMPQGASVEGNVLTNDEEVVDVVSAQYYDASGLPKDLSLGEETTVYGKDKNGAWVEVGKMTLNSDGTYTFKPKASYIGDVPIEYTAQNDAGTSDNATLTIKVIPNPDTDSNNPPIAQDDTYTVEQGQTAAVPVLDNDSDPDGDNLTVTEVKANGSGGTPVVLTSTPQDIYGEDGTTVVGQASVDPNGNIVFTPAADFTGDVPFDYTISDGNGGTDTAVATVTVLPSNDTNEVYANDDANTGKRSETLTGNVLTNDSDPEGDDFTVTMIDTDGDGTPDAAVDGSELTITQNGAEAGKLTINADGTYTWKPAADFVGTVAIPYEITDNPVTGNVQAKDVATLYLTNLPFADCGFLRSNRNVTRQLIK